MSVTALKWVRQQMPRGKNGGPDPQGKAILLVLAMMHNERSDIDLFPSQRTLSRETGLSVSTVNDRLRSLEVQGYVSRSRRYRQHGSQRGQRSTDRYVLNLDRPPDDLDRRAERPASLEPNSGSRRAGGAANSPLRYENFGTDPRFDADRSRRGLSTWTALELATEAVDLLLWIGYPRPPRPETLVPAIHDLDSRYGRHQSKQRAELRRVLLDRREVEYLIRREVTADRAVLEILIAVAVEQRTIDASGSIPEADAEAGRFLAVDGSRHHTQGDCRAHDLALEHQRFNV